MTAPASPMPMPAQDARAGLVEALTQAIRAALPGAQVAVRDDSHKHAGHAGVRERGGGHYHADVDWPGFKDMPRLARHRLVLAAVAPWQAQGLIHAFAMTLTHAGAPC